MSTITPLSITPKKINTQTCKISTLFFFPLDLFLNIRVELLAKKIYSDSIVTRSGGSEHKKKKSKGPQFNESLELQRYESCLNTPVEKKRVSSMTWIMTDEMFRLASEEFEKLDERKEFRLLSNRYVL